MTRQRKNSRRRKTGRTGPRSRRANVNVRNNGKSVSGVTPGDEIDVHPTWGLLLTPDATPMKINPLQLFNYVQEVSLGTIVSSSTPGTEVDGALYFYMGQLDQTTTFAALFDQYRFLQVTVYFVPRATMAGTTGTIFPTAVGHLSTCLDYDDATAITFANMRQRETCQTTLAIAEHGRTITPHAALAAYSGTFASYANFARMWIDSGSPNVQHYAVKYALTDCGFTSQTMYDVYARYVVQFKSVQ